MKYLKGALLLCLLTLVTAPAREAKERDKDLNYDEDKLPRYDLPPLLVAADGKPITTPEQWRNIRRPQMTYRCSATWSTPASPSPWSQFAQSSISLKPTRSS